MLGRYIVGKAPRVWRRLTGGRGAPCPQGALLILCPESPVWLRWTGDYTAARTVEHRLSRPILAGLNEEGSDEEGSGTLQQPAIHVLPSVVSRCCSCRLLPALPYMPWSRGTGAEIKRRGHGPCCATAICRADYPGAGRAW